MLSAMDPDISVPTDYNNSAEKLFVELVDKCRNRFQDGDDLYRLARALGLDINENIKLPGEEWPSLVENGYHEIAHRLEGHDEEDGVLIDLDEDPWAARRWTAFEPMWEECLGSV